MPLSRDFRHQVYLLKGKYGVVSLCIALLWQCLCFYKIYFIEMVHLSRIVHQKCHRTKQLTCYRDFLVREGSAAMM